MSAEEVIGQAIHELTTSVNHRFALPTGLDEDCRVLGRVIAKRLAPSEPPREDAEEPPETWRDEGIDRALRRGEPLSSFQRARILERLASEPPREDGLRAALEQIAQDVLVLFRLDPDQNRSAVLDRTLANLRALAASEAGSSNPDRLDVEPSDGR